MASALSATSDAVFTALNVPALLALAAGGIWDATPTRPVFDFVLYELQEREVGALGEHDQVEIALSVHVYTQDASLKNAQAIVAEVKTLLKNAALTIAGHTHDGRVFWDDTVALLDELVAGVPCHELITRFRIFVE